MTQKHVESYIETLHRLGGYYKCPYVHGRRAGPLVGYADRYDDKHQWVGEEYINFAKAEEDGNLLGSIARRMAGFPELLRRDEYEGFCGAPEGGKALAAVLAVLLGKRYIFPDKKGIVPETDTSRELSLFSFDRHRPKQGGGWWIVEDVCNNFSTAKNIIELIEGYEAKVKGIICFFNRSLTVDKEFSEWPGVSFPVHSLIHQGILRYKQDDPFVAEDVQKGNIVWKPKFEWDRLA